MFSEQGKKDPNRQRRIVAGAVFAGLSLVSGVVHAATLTALIDQAKREGALSVTVTSSMTGKTTPKLAASFKKRFGLEIEVTITPVSDVAHTSKAVAETKTGVVPTYDAIEGADTNKFTLLQVGGLQRIDGWQALVAEINPLVRSGKVRPEQVSPAPLSGHAFMYASRLKALLYNPRLISKEGLPKTHAELADPTYKGKWTQPPWTSHWDIAPLAFSDFNRERWLDTIRRAGKNAAAVQPEQGGVDRLLLGEYAFALSNEYYAFRAKGRDPQAPVEITYFKDYNQTNFVFYVVRNGARHPAAATLFALWMTTPEAESIWQPELFLTHFLWGESDLDRKTRQDTQQSGAKMVDFLSTEKGRELLAWYATEEGRKYRQAIGRAIKGE